MGASLILLPSLPSPCSHNSPHSPASWTSLPMSNEQLTMYWGLHHLWGQGARGQHGSKLKLAPLTPRSLPLLPLCSSSLPAHSQLTPSLLQLPARSSLLTPLAPTLLPAHSQLAPAPSLFQLTPSLLQLTPSSLPARSSLLPMAMYVLGSPPPVGCKGLWGKVGVSWSKLWSKLKQAGVNWGASWE